MNIKYFKKCLKIIVIITMAIIITGMMSSKTEAVKNSNIGKTLLNYVDVDIKPEKGKELKILLPNYNNTVINKVKVSQTGKELKILQDSVSKEHYVLYTGKTGEITLEFYKKGATIPFVAREMKINQEQDGMYSAIVAPQITFSTETNKDRTFKITDTNGINEIIICKRNTKGVYDYKEENIIYKNNVKEDTKINPQYVNTPLEELGNKALIKINRLYEYGYYEIKVVGNSGLTNIREVKVRGKMKTPQSAAKVENGFAPNIKIVKNDPEKVTFKISEKNKVTSAKMYQIIDGKISSKEIKLDNIKKKGNYITSFTFAKEGMFRLKLLNKTGEKVACLTDFVINKKNNTDTWKVNESPRVVRSTKGKDTQKIKISDSNIKTIKIFVKENGKYDQKKPIYIYEDGKILKTTANYIDEKNSNYKDKNNIYLAFKRLSEDCRYLIKVTDKDGNNIELTRNKLFLVDKK